ncbi:MAG: hypothetical protein KDA33_03065 [Phycisphaerales bacterium]|nr:hypothetical protein [Phycisphaerales bacterium]
MKPENLEGLIPIVGAVLAMLVAKGVIPRNPKDPEKLELARRRFGGFITVAGPFLILIGILQLCRLF